MQVLVIGPAFLDVIAAPVERLPEPGEELPVGAVELSAGGFAIAATALRRLGVATALAAPLGDDRPGEYLTRLLAEESVDLVTAGVRATPTTIALNRGGDRAFLTAGFPDGDALRTAGLRALRLHPHCQAVHLSCRGPFAADIARAARAQGCFVAMDCGTDVEWLESEALARTLRLADIYLPNAREASIVTGARDPALAAARLLDLVPQAVVKLGADGVLFAGADGIVHQPTGRLDAVDPTGAGDVFDAGYLAGRVYGFAALQSVRLGQYAAGRAIARLGGASGAPTLTQARGDLADLPWPGT